MTLMVQADFLSGKENEDVLVSLSHIFDSLMIAQEDLLSWTVDQIIEILDKFSLLLLDQHHPIHKLFPNSGIPFIANWCRKTNLESVLDTSLGNRYSLDRFIESKACSDRCYRAFPKGIVVHWMAGNVPTLGFLSLVQGMLTKNVNFIKVASNSDDMLSMLLHHMSKINIKDNRSGANLVRSVAVIRYEHSRKDIGENISKKADVRVLWGSDESVSAVQKLPTKINAVDVTFPNKTSLMLIGASALEKADIKLLTKRIATDISVFEQKACASPHTIFIETNDDSKLVVFAESLKRSLQKILDTIPKTVPSEKEIASLLNLRARYDMFYRAWYSEGTEFTILVDDLFQLGPPIGNRTIYLRMVDKLEKVSELITPNVQSVGILSEAEQYENITSKFSVKGVQRFTQIGAMTHFEVPWDGYFLPQYLVRWTSRPIIRAK